MTKETTPHKAQAKDSKACAFVVLVNMDQPMQFFADEMVEQKQSVLIPAEIVIIFQATNIAVWPMVWYTAS